jgi:hypothetical protein
MVLKLISALELKLSASAREGEEAIQVLLATPRPAGASCLKHNPIIKLGKGRLFCGRGVFS